MTRVTIHLEKSLEENASLYYEKAKKLKKKTQGAKEAIEEQKKKLEKLEKGLLKIKPVTEEKKPTKSEWYEKFRWFKSSEGFLVIGGRDATSNEIVIKKHTDANDLVFHTDMAGSPFFVLKTEGKKPGKATLLEVADATCSYARAWKLGLSSTPVFYVKPEQVTKKAKAGEFIPKGAFMIYGKTNYIDNKMNLAIGMTDDKKIMGGPPEAIEKHCKQFVAIEQGKEKTSDIAKKIRKKIGGDLDTIVRNLPAGGCRIKK